MSSKEPKSLMGSQVCLITSTGSMEMDPRSDPYYPILSPCDPAASGGAHSHCDSMDQKQYAPRKSNSLIRRCTNPIYHSQIQKIIIINCQLYQFSGAKTRCSRAIAFPSKTISFLTRIEVGDEDNFRLIKKIGHSTYNSQNIESIKAYFIRTSFFSDLASL